MRKSTLAMVSWIIPACLVLPAAAHSQSKISNPRIDKDGTTYIPSPITAIPATEFWSPELRNIYISQVEPALARQRLVYPSESSSIEERIKFMKEVQAINKLEESRVAQQSQYPVDISHSKIGGVPVTIITPKGGVSPANRGRVLLRAPSIGAHPNRWVNGTMPLASMSGIKTVVIDANYKMDNKSLQRDMEVVYQELLRTIQPKSIGLFGYGNEGGLASQFIARIGLRGWPTPGALALLSSAVPPVFDSRKGDSAIWAPTMFQLFGNSATPKPVSKVENKPEDFPGSSDQLLAKFPPTVFVTGTRSPHMSPVIAAHTRMLRLDVDSSMYIVEGGFFGFEFLAWNTPEFRDMTGYIARWFSRKLER